MVYNVPKLTGCTADQVLEVLYGSRPNHPALDDEIDRILKTAQGRKTEKNPPIK